MAEPPDTVALVLGPLGSFFRVNHQRQPIRAKRRLFFQVGHPQAGRCTGRVRLFGGGPVQTDPPPAGSRRMESEGLAEPLGSGLRSCSPSHSEGHSLAVSGSGSPLPRPRQPGAVPRKDNPRGIVSPAFSITCHSSAMRILQSRGSLWAGQASAAGTPTGNRGRPARNPRLLDGALTAAEIRWGDIRLPARGCGGGSEPRPKGAVFFLQGLAALKSGHGPLPFVAAQRVPLDVGTHSGGKFAGATFALQRVAAAAVLSRDQRERSLQGLGCLEER
jgi:hypothetical protein